MLQAGQQPVVRQRASGQQSLSGEQLLSRQQVQRFVASCLASLLLAMQYPLAHTPPGTVPPGMMAAGGSGSDVQTSLALASRHSRASAPDFVDHVLPLPCIQRLHRSLQEGWEQVDV